MTAFAKKPRLRRAYFLRDQRSDNEEHDDIERGWGAVFSCDAKNKICRGTLEQTFI